MEFYPAKTRILGGFWLLKMLSYGNIYIITLQMQVVTAASFSHNTPQKGLMHNAERPFHTHMVFASSVLRFVCSRRVLYILRNCSDLKMEL